MGIWSSITGVVSIHKDKKISLKSIVEDCFDKHTFSCYTEMED